MLTRITRHVIDRIETARDPVGFARRLGVTIGQECRFLGTSRATFGSEPYLITIGDHVTITAGVRFINHDGGVWVLRKQYPAIDVVDRITVHHNVFIGTGAILLPGIEIGPDVVIAAGAVVSRSVPPGTVAGGVPARPIKSITEYAADISERAIQTKGLPAKERRRVFLAQRPTPAGTAIRVSSGDVEAIRTN